MKNDLFEKLTTKANQLISNVGSLDLALSIIANNNEEDPELRQLASQVLTGDKF